MANFNFNAVLKLQADAFKKGINEVKGALNGLKNTFLTVAGILGAGLSFGELGKKLVDTATKLSVAQASLKNVSDTSKNINDTFAKNYKFISDLAHTYSQDIITLTGSYSKFHAAANSANIALEDQKLIFESLTRASTFYHLSAEETAGVMTAVEQMMSKGKVTAEELRRQLGNSLPGAFGLMARALGMTNAELDKAMKNGQVYAEQALPKFAAMLNSVTKNIDLDSIQLNKNALNNAWAEMVQRIDFQSYYNKIIRSVTKVLEYITEHITGLKTTAEALIVSLTSLFAFKGIAKTGVNYINEQEKALASYQRQLEKVQKVQQMGNKKGSNWDFSADFGKAASPKDMSRATQKELKAMIDYNNKLLEANKIKKSINQIPFMDKYEVERVKLMNGGLQETLKLMLNYSTITSQNNNYLAQNINLQSKRKDIAAALKQLESLITEEIKKGSAANKQAIAALTEEKERLLEINNLRKQGNVIGKAGIAIGKAFQKIVGDIWAFMKANVIMAVATAVLGILTKIVATVREHRKETERLINLNKSLDDAIAEQAKQTETSNNEIRSQVKMLADTKLTEEKRVGIIKKLNEELGNTGKQLFTINTSQEEINKRVNEWLETSRKVSKMEFLANEADKAEFDFENAKRKYEQLDNEWKRFHNGLSFAATPKKDRGDIFGLELGGPNVGEMQRAQFAIKQLGDAYKYVSGKLDEANAALGDYWKELYDAEKDGGDGANDLSDLYSKYNKSVKELENKMHEGAITAEEYSDALYKLKAETFDKAAATGQLSITKILGKPNLTEMEKWYKDLSLALIDGSDSMIREADEAFYKEALESAERRSKALEEANNLIAKKAEEERKKNLADLDVDMMGIPQAKQRETLFDFDKKQSEKLEEQKDINDALIEQLRQQIEYFQEEGKQTEKVKERLNQLYDELVDATAAAEGLDKALMLAKATERVKELKQDLTEGIYGGIKTAASSLDRVTKGMENLKSVMEDDDATGWDKFISIFNEVIQIVDTIVGVYNTIQKVGKTITLLQGAQLTEQLALNAAKTAQIGLEEAILKKQKAQAAAAAAANAMEVPFPANLAALAANEAAILGAMSAAQAFAKGGIVNYGSSSGDKTLARVNKGEGILTASGVKNLQSLYNSQGTGGIVEFKIRGDQLVGVINNYNAKRRGK